MTVATVGQLIAFGVRYYHWAFGDVQIVLLLGAIPKDDGKSNPLDEMTEQEKEEEAEKLAGLIQDLNRKGLIRTAQVGPDGRPQEFQGAQALGEEATEQEDEFTGDSESISNGNVDERKLSQNEGNSGIRRQKLIVDYSQRIVRSS